VALVKLFFESSVLLALVAWTATQFLSDIWITNAAEVKALEEVAKFAEARVVTNDKRGRALRILHFKLLNYHLWIPIVLLSDKELAILAPFIDERCEWTVGSATETAALSSFKQRMVQRGRWPR
jgi:hypothetical protein